VPVRIVVSTGKKSKTAPVMARILIEMLFFLTLSLLFVYSQEKL